VAEIRGSNAGSAALVIPLIKAAAAGLFRAELGRCRRLLGAGAEAAAEEDQAGRAGGPLLRGAAGRLLAGAGYPAGARPGYLRRAGLGWAALAICSWLLAGWGGAMIAAAGAALEILRLHALRLRRRAAFEGDYTALLISLASAVRAGMDPLAALGECGRLLPEGSPARIEVESLCRSIDSGSSERSAILAFAADIDHPDIALFRSCFLLARTHGSSLGPCLQRLAKVTRQRQSFRRKIRAAVAMQRLSSIGIAACAAAIGLIQAFANLEGLREAFAHPVGHRILIGGAGLIAAGLIWMSRLAGPQA